MSFAKENGICVVHDFAYGAVGFDGCKPLSFLQTEGAKDIGIEIYTLSKTYNMAGWRVGFAVGNASVIEAINLYQDHMFVSLFRATQEAATKALLADQTCVAEQNARYESRRNAWIAACREIGWDVTAPAGSFLHGCLCLKTILPSSSQTFCSKKRMWRLRLETASVNMARATSESDC